MTRFLRNDIITLWASRAARRIATTCAQRKNAENPRLEGSRRPRTRPPQTSS